MNNLILKKCDSCGALIKVIKDCNCKCGIMCCDKEMDDIKPNSVDASIEKHKPEYEVIGNKIKVKVNHVMEDNHYIEWISMVYDNKEETVYFKPGDNPYVEFDYIKGSQLYSYCNLHSLWTTEVL